MQLPTRNDTGRRLSRRFALPALWDPNPSNRVDRRYPFSSTIAVTEGAPSKISSFAICSPSVATFFQHADLLEELFAYFLKSHHTRQQRKELMNYMLVSKALFHYPAQVLWSCVGNLFASALGGLLDIEKWDGNLDRKLKGVPLLM